MQAREASRRPRDRGRAHPPGRTLPSHGSLEAPPTDFFRLYKSTYPKKIDAEDRSGVPPPQASVATKNLSGALLGVGERSRNSKFSYVSPRSIYGETSYE